eukprot:Ihof_evm13s129 gene=Ihof_evmTU13s129
MSATSQPSQTTLYYCKTWNPILDTLTVREVLTPFRRMLYSCALRPALGSLKDGVVSIADKVEPLLYNLADRKSINIFNSNMIGAAEDRLKMIDQYEKDCKAFEKEHESIVVKGGSDDPRDSVLGDPVILLAAGNYKSKFNWPGQCTARVIGCQLEIITHSYSPVGSADVQHTVQKGPSPELMVQTHRLCNEFQVSRVLRLAIELADITALAFIPDESDGDTGLLIVIFRAKGNESQLEQRYGHMKFSRRRVLCSDRKRNEWKSTSDFSPHHQLSQSDHLVLGGETKKLEMIVACLCITCPRLQSCCVEGEVPLQVPLISPEAKKKSVKSKEMKGLLQPLVFI